MVASIPRLIRNCLRSKKNELLYEVDMASAQPSILILEYLKVQFVLKYHLQSTLYLLPMLYQVDLTF